MNHLRSHPSSSPPSAESPHSPLDSSLISAESAPSAQPEASVSTDKMTSRVFGRDRVVPTAACYWAVLDASSLGHPLLGRAATRSKQLGYLFESQLPVPVESVQAVYLSLGDATATGRAETRSKIGRNEKVLACGIDRERLAALAGMGQDEPTSGGDDDGPVSMCPSEIPPELEAHGADPRALNLLVGDFEPPALRHARRRWCIQLAAVILACIAIIVAGLERRVQAASVREAAAREAIAGVYERVLPPAPAGGGGGTQPPALRLTAELRRLRMTRQNPFPALDGPDAMSTVASVLAAWPADDGRLRIQAELVTATADGSTVRVLVPDHEQAQALQAALDRVVGLKAGPPQIATQRDAVRVDFRLTRTKEGNP